MATPHNGIIKGNIYSIQYNTQSKAFLLACTSSFHYVVYLYKPYFLQGTSHCMYIQFVFVNVYFKCTTQRFAQEGGFGQTHEI